MPQPPATKPLGLPFIELQSVDSTNNYAREQVHAGLAQHGMAIFSQEQVQGKGQRGKVWTTEKAANIVLSLLINPQPFQLTQLFQLSACVAVAVHEFYGKYAGDETKIKWPNDLYWQDRKAGGVLIENVVGRKEFGTLPTGRQVRDEEFGPNTAEPTGSIWKWAIAGIGINVNQTVFPGELKNPVSLKQITGKVFNPVELAKELCAVLDKRFLELITVGFENIYADYKKHLYKRNETVKLKKGSKIFESVIEGVSPAGKLIVQHGIEKEFDFGEVEWVV